ncbi:MAG: hypothetical protein NT061_10390 [Spirochaetes bacterium]|nr:hypothetical protein [Spirochaetota bacterium]
MTLKTRRRAYWALFGISLSQLLLGTACLLALLLSRNPAVFLIEHDIYKVHRLFGLHLPSHLLSAFDSLVLAAFAVVTGGSILRSFQKTVSAEIFYFSFWLSTLSFEPLRLLHFLLALNGEADTVLGAFDKLYMGIKIFGYICLFISGLYAAGMRSERQFAIVAVAAATSAFLSLALPVNSGIWTWNLMFKTGYGSLITGFTMATILITIADYLIAIRMRGDKAYYPIAVGMASVSIGAFFLGRDLSPAVSLVSLLAVTAGGILYVYRLHSFYLWQ